MSIAAKTTSFVCQLVETNKATVVMQIQIRISTKLIAKVILIMEGTQVGGKQLYGSGWHRILIWSHSAVLRTQKQAGDHFRSIAALKSII